VKTDGTLWSWGDNASSQLGRTCSVSQPCESPRQVGSDNTWSFVAAGGYFSLAVKADGSLWAWGANALGQLGDGSTTPRSAPVRIGSDADWSLVAGGGFHSVAVKQNGTLWTWGSNQIGQLGRTCGGASCWSPGQVGTEGTWSLVAAGWEHTVTVKSAPFTLWAWGENYYGQLGDGTGFLPTPVRVK
jgi:alpha-tubulin suppressor-like RCC1 family protein